jgi:hypothetical protein
MIFKEIDKAIEYFKRQYEWVDEEIGLIIEYLKKLNSNFVFERLSTLFYAGIDNEYKDSTNFISQFFEITPKGAWARCLEGNNDELISLVLSDYISRAFNEVKPLLENKQNQEAMKIFIKRYKELKLKNWNENFFISYGYDISGREKAEKEALDLKLITEKNCLYLESKKEKINLPIEITGKLKKILGEK